MIPFVLAPAAAEDIQNIDDRLVEDSKAAAERVSEAMAAAMTRLAGHPMLGHHTHRGHDRLHRRAVGHHSGQASRS